MPSFEELISDADPDFIDDALSAYSKFKSYPFDALVMIKINIRNADNPFLKAKLTAIKHLIAEKRGVIS